MLSVQTVPEGHVFFLLPFSFLGYVKKAFPQMQKARQWGLECSEAFFRPSLEGLGEGLWILHS